MVKKLAIVASFPAFMLAARIVPFDRLPSTCMFYHVSGLPCPSCGMTRSVISLARLDLQNSLAFNPLGTLFVVVCGMIWGTAVYQIATGRRTRLDMWARRNFTTLILAGLAMLIVFGALRIWALTR